VRARGQFVDVVIRPFERADERQVVELWRRCGLLRPWNDPHRDIVRKAAVQPDLFLVGDVDGLIVATAMAGYDGHRGWINYLAVAPERRLQGMGLAIVAHAEQALLDMGCPKINVQVRADNATAIGFYEAAGFRFDDVVSLGKRLVPDDGEQQAGN
jgi:ribosomal protein S18 acetylase RimI-like enzyme